MIFIKKKLFKKAEEYKFKLPEGSNKPLIYDTYMKMLNEIDIDLVAIAIESGYHSAIAIDCLNAGKHGLVEKPIALSTYDADEMVKTAKKIILN